MSKIMKNHNLKTRRNGLMKDIEEWINEKPKKEGNKEFDDFMNKNSHKDSRMSGQLPENVTEERLLHAHLFELGNERYKFLSRFAFEKQQFQDKRVKRINAMKSRINSAGAASAPSRLGSSYSRVSERNGRYNGIRFDEIDGRELPSRARTVHFMPSQTRKTESRILEVSTPTSHHESTFSRFGSRFTKPNKFSKFGGSIPTKTKDPRYSFLEKSLSPAYTEGKCKQSVREIVKRIESLHRLPGLGFTKLDIGSKILDFSKENGLSMAGMIKSQMALRRLKQKVSPAGTT